MIDLLTVLLTCLLAVGQTAPPAGWITPRSYGDLEPPPPSVMSHAQTSATPPTWPRYKGGTVLAIAMASTATASTTATETETATVSEVDHAQSGGILGAELRTADFRNRL